MLARHDLALFPREIDAKEFAHNLENVPGMFYWKETLVEEDDGMWVVAIVSEQDPKKRVVAFTYGWIAAFNYAKDKHLAAAEMNFDLDLLGD